MKRRAAFLKLIRYPNLIYIALTQFLLQYCVVAPVLRSSGVDPSLSVTQFILLCLSTILIAAAGYIINDYFDINIDIINKPEKMVLDKVIPRRWAMAWHSIFNMLGVSLGFIVAWKTGQIYLGFTQVICSLLLWFYSTSYKRQVLVGNVIISLLTALSVVVVGFYEKQIYESFAAIMSDTGRKLIQIIGVYALFAFVISMIREIVKDLEDMMGDSKDGCRTLPIAWGVLAAKRLCNILLLVLLVTILLVEIKVATFGWYAAIVYLVLLVQLPCIYVYMQLKKAHLPEHYHKVSSLVKVVMLTGILSMIFFKIFL
ncbi:geranylgeranylglycerol-phosphate geranylgeranyltransferase [Chitinophaga nivalis]|uniref:Geranylgeranylglycerol-phosphate geranylgeranyltransferase n=1 Tax=Chitinophaga nivalis TaxID=2991709 RepID=A0ABT3IRQ9_9BACT|nr:geranylgeranylglycerol-phosphate geranylgeranyltransferase [Chitinophaga nivalis]MCW3463647.1 geranylgeranylglycerol-phosphate geranylgeranyltransferase [Chitinophaga nivalis]MCW3486663.1 geranylgeranylglycerol-phosphate geranylgeranyltransferase [Chitinophaga nivalis]